MTDAELKKRVLDLTEEWHDAEPVDDAYHYSLINWIAHNLDITPSQAKKILYGDRDDGAVL